MDSEFINQVLAICGAITCVGAAVGVVVKLIIWAKKPNDQQNKRLDLVEDKIEEIEKKLGSDLNRISKIEEQDRIIMESLLALLAHGIDGNDIESMKKAKEKLNEYLIQK